MTLLAFLTIDLLELVPLSFFKSKDCQGLYSNPSARAPTIHLYLRGTGRDHTRGPLHSFPPDTLLISVKYALFLTCDPHCTLSFSVGVLEKVYSLPHQHILYILYTIIYSVSSNKVCVRCMILIPVCGMIRWFEFFYDIWIIHSSTNTKEKKNTSLFITSPGAGVLWQVMVSWADRWSAACRDIQLYEPHCIWILRAAVVSYVHILNHLSMHYSQNWLYNTPLCKLWSSVYTFFSLYSWAHVRQLE